MRGACLTSYPTVSQQPRAYQPINYRPAPPLTTSNTQLHRASHASRTTPDTWEGACSAPGYSAAIAVGVQAVLCCAVLCCMRELFQSVLLQAVPWGLGERQATFDAVLDRYREVHEVRIAGSRGWDGVLTELSYTVLHSTLTAPSVSASMKPGCCAGTRESYNNSDLYWTSTATTHHGSGRRRREGKQRLSPADTDDKAVTKTEIISDDTAPTLLHRVAPGSAPRPNQPDTTRALGACGYGEILFG